MNKYLLLYWCILLTTMGCFAQNCVSITAISGNPGDEVEVAVMLENTDAITAVEVQIPLPDKQLRYVEGSAKLNADRSNGHQVSAAVVDGALRLYAYSLSLAPLKGNAGTLFTFTLRIGREPGVYTLQPQVVLSNAAGQAIEASAVASSATILAPKIALGTTVVNYGHIPIRRTYTQTLTVKNTGTLPLSITNVTCSDAIFTPAETAFEVPTGGLYALKINYAPLKWGAVDAHVLLESNAINGNIKATLQADPYSVNEWIVSNEQGVADEVVTVKLSLRNMEPIVGVQCAFVMPDGLEYVDGSFVGVNRAASLQTAATLQGTKLTLMLYSLQNTPMDEGDEVVATFQCKLVGKTGYYYLKPTEVVLSNKDLVNMVSATAQGRVYIKSPKLSCGTTWDMGKSPVTQQAVANFSVQNLGNVPLVIDRVTFMAEGYEVLTALPLQIANGKSTNLQVGYTGMVAGNFSTTMNIYSNDPTNRMQPVTVSGQRYEPNGLDARGENLQNGNYVLSVGMNNYTDIVAVQMDVHWKEGMRTSMAQLAATTRLAGHAYTVAPLDSDTYRIIIYSMQNAAIGGNEGDLFALTFVPDNGVEYKDTYIRIDNVVLSSAKGENFASMQALNIKAEFVNYFMVYLLDGAFYKAVAIKVGDKIEPLAEPTKEGYTFSGWSETPATMPARDVEVTGSFIVNSYNLIYKVDGEVYETITLDYGTSIELLAEPTKEGYTFSGWSEAPATMPAKDVEISGSFNVNSYNLIYKVDGEVYETVSVEYGSAITLLDEPVKEGYTFSGWSDAPPTMPANDVEVTGSFNVNSYNLVYKVGGEVYETVSLEYGSAITLLDEPVKEGYTFSGWSKAPATMPARDVEISGTFIINSYDLIYKVDGEVYETVSVEYGSAIILLEEPVKEGYTFSGWSEAPTTMSASDVEVTGSFSVNSYNLIYKVDGEVYETITLNYGTSIELLPEPTKTGYTFSGWGEAPATMPAREVEVTGSFNVNSYNLVYKVDGEVYETVSVEYGSAITLLDEPIKEGYTFSGWGEAPTTMPAKNVEISGNFTINTYKLTYLVDGEVTQTISVEYGIDLSSLADKPIKEGYSYVTVDVIPTTMPAHDLEIDGTFIPNSYNLIYKVGSTEYAVVAVLYGEEIVLIDEPTKEGYTFSGWSEAPPTMPAHDVEIKGSFKANTYTITYMVDGEIYETRTARTNSLVQGLSNLKRNYCTFSGWKSATPGLNITAFPGISGSTMFFMPGYDVVIEGSFTCEEYNLIYKVDGEVYETVSVEYGSVITLLDEPVKEGYTFSGWSKAPATMPARDVEILGSFKANTYTVTYIVDGEVYETVSVEYGADITLLDEPVKEGYTFSGWGEAPATMPASDVEILGSFKANTYTVTYIVDGEVYETITVNYGTSIELLPEPTKTGYTFSGWSEAPTIMPAYDIEIRGYFDLTTEIVDENIVEESNNEIYNLKGQRLESLKDQPPGVYIVGGRKIRIVQTKQTNQR